MLRYKAGGAAARLPRVENTAYSPELKLQAVKAYLSGEDSLEGICQRFQISGITTLSRWIKVYNGHGDFNSVKQSGDGSYMRQGRETTLEERIQIVRECIASGKNCSDRGFQYTSRAFHYKLEQAGMAQSMSRVAHCIGNGPMRASGAS